MFDGGVVVDLFGEWDFFCWKVFLEELFDVVV